MSTNRYAVSEKAEKVKTGKMLYITSAVFGTDWKSYPHTHYFSELFYFTSGKGEFLVEDQKFKVGRGDVVIVNPNIRHTEMSSVKYPLEYLVIGIEGLHFSFGGQQDYAQFPLAENSLHAEIWQELLTEVQQHEPHYEQVCQKLVDVFLIRLMRSEEFNFSVAQPRAIPNECNIIKRYIDANFTEQLTLDTLAEQVHLNKYYLAHMFTEAYGIPPISYLMELKMRCAQEHLAGSDLTVAQVAQVSGFSSQCYFAQVFRKAKGITPLEYRKRSKAKIITAEPA